MNECEQIHPLLRGYLGETLSARERRLVARHLNLCASARGELDRLRGGAGRFPEGPTAPPTEPWDLKILRWLFKTPKPTPRRTPAKPKQNRRPEPEPEEDLSKRSPLKPILVLLVLFVGLGFLTHLIQNAGGNPWIQGAKRWLAQKGLGVKPSLELTLDLTNLPQWDGTAAPTALEWREVIVDPDRLGVYWSLLMPGLPPPQVDFQENAVVLVLTGSGPKGAWVAEFKRSDRYSDRTVLWYDEVPQEPAGYGRFWVLQLVPKPEREPVLIQKIQ